MVKHRRTRYMTFYIMLTAMSITFIAFYLLDTDMHWIQLAVRAQRCGDHAGGARARRNQPSSGLSSLSCLMRAARHPADSLP